MLVLTGATIMVIITLSVYPSSFALLAFVLHPHFFGFQFLFFYWRELRFLPRDFNFEPHGSRVLVKEQSNAILTGM